MQICAFDGRRMLMALRRLWGHVDVGPRLVEAQSKARMRSPISPPPVSHAAAASGRREDRRSSVMLGADSIIGTLGRRPPDRAQPCVKTFSELVS
jgi:hypothetical protein